MKYLRKFNESGTQKWAIYSGLSGGFGGANFIKFFNGTQAHAEKEAYCEASDQYESYEGMHGLRSVSDIMEEDEVDESEAEEIYNEEKEGWLDYWVEPFDPNKEYS